jgi:hypothetical protein
MTASNKGLGSIKSLVFFLPLLLWLFASVVNAAPLGEPAELAKRKPAFPSLDDCKAKFTAPPKDKSLYFTGLKTRKDINTAKKYATDHGLVHVGLSYPTGFTDPGNYDGTDADKRTFQENFSKLYAEGTTGDAYLMLDDGKTPASDSIFLTVEFPAMRDSAKTTKILQFPFTNPPDDPTKVTKRFWPDDSGAAGPGNGP